MVLTIIVMMILILNVFRSLIVIMRPLSFMWHIIGVLLLMRGFPIASLKSLEVSNFFIIWHAFNSSYRCWNKLRAFIRRHMFIIVRIIFSIVIFRSFLWILRSMFSLQRRNIIISLMMILLLSIGTITSIFWLNKNNLRSASLHLRSHLLILISLNAILFLRLQYIVFHYFLVMPARLLVGILNFSHWRFWFSRLNIRWFRWKTWLIIWDKIRWSLWSAMIRAMSLLFNT